MSDSEDVVLADVAIIIAVAASQQNRCRRRPRRFWIRPSLMLNDIDNLNFEHICDVGFQNLFRVNNSGFENILSMIALIIIK